MKRVLICSITSKPALAWSTFGSVYIRGLCIFIAQGLILDTDFYTRVWCEIYRTVSTWNAIADGKSWLSLWIISEALTHSWRDREGRSAKDQGTYCMVLLSRKHLFLRRPAQSCTPTMPNIKKTKKHSRRTLPNIGRVSRSRVTSILIPAQTKEQRETEKHAFWQVSNF